MNEIDPRLQAYLDGELRLEDLPAALRERAGEWDRLLGQVARSGPAGAPLGFEREVMEALRKEIGSPVPQESAGRTSRPAWLEWAVRPRSVRVSPIAALAMAAALALVVTRPWSGADSVGPEADVDGRVFVQFVVEAEGARSVQLAGDFSDWQPLVELADPDGDGTWSGRVPLEPGVHEYMFVIDGTEWMADPNATGSRDDGFGRKNSLLAVSEITGT